MPAGAVAGGNALGGVAPVAAGGGMGPMVMGARATSGGSNPGLAVPLEYDLAEDDVDDW